MDGIPQQFLKFFLKELLFANKSSVSVERIDDGFDDFLYKLKAIDTITLKKNVHRVVKRACVKNIG